MAYNEIKPVNGAIPLIQNHDKNVSEINGPLSNIVSSISTSREIFLRKGEDIFSVENNFINGKCVGREKFDKYTRDFNIRVHNEIIDPIIENNAKPQSESTVSPRLIELTEKSAIEELLKLAGPSEASALKKKLGKAKPAALISLTNMAMLIQELDAVVEFKDRAKQYREELIKLIEGDELDHHSGFTAFHEGNNYLCVIDLQEKIYKSCDIAFPDGGIFEATFIKKVMPEIAKNLTRQFGHLSDDTLDKIRDSKGLISAIAAKTVAEMLQTTDTKSFASMVAHLRLCLHWIELMRSTEKAPVCGDDKNCPGPAPLQRPISGLGDGGAPQIPLVQVNTTITNNGVQSDSKSSGTKPEVSTLVNGIPTSLIERHRVQTKSNISDGEDNLDSMIDSEKKKPSIPRKSLNTSSGPQSTASAASGVTPENDVHTPVTTGLVNDFASGRNMNHQFSEGSSGSETIFPVSHVSARSFSNYLRTIETPLRRQKISDFEDEPNRININKNEGSIPATGEYPRYVTNAVNKFTKLNLSPLIVPKFPESFPRSENKPLNSSERQFLTWENKPHHLQFSAGINQGRSQTPNLGLTGIHRSQ